MGFLAGLEQNDLIGFLALESNVEYMKEALTFLFCAGVVGQVGIKSRTLVSCLGLSFLRCFGDLSIVLALGMGTMPGLVFQNLDWYMNVLVAAIVWNYFADKFVPDNICDNLNWAYDFAWSMTKANNAGIGYAMVQQALPGSFFAPFFGAYLAVNGARLLEKGVGAIKGGNSCDNTDVLAIGSGVIIYVLTSEQFGAAATFARAALVVFSFSQNWINYMSYWNKFVASVTGAVNGASGKSKRNVTPAKRR